jgi:hypothetical protein
MCIDFSLQMELSNDIIGFAKDIKFLAKKRNFQKIAER